MVCDVVVNYGTYLGQQNAIISWFYRDKCTKLPIDPVSPTVSLYKPDDTQVTFADTSVPGVDVIVPTKDADGTVTGQVGRYYITIGNVDAGEPAATSDPYYYLLTTFTWEGETTTDAQICFVVAPEPAPQNPTEPPDVGIYAISTNVSTIEPATFFCEWLGQPGLWDSSRTDGSVPIIIPEEELRRVNFTRRDIITCRFEGEDLDFAGIDYEHEHAMEEGVFRVYTRKGRLHAHKLALEAKRLLQKLRVDPFGSQPDSIGRNFLVVKRIQKKESVTRATWEREILVDLTTRWRSIMTEDP